MNIKHLAERFCAAPLPESVCADLCATRPGPGRSGTSLLTVEEAKEVLAHVFQGELCTWIEDANDDGVWYACDAPEGGRNAFSFECGGPDENEFKFCPYCGKPIAIQTDIRLGENGPVEGETDPM